MSFTYGHTNWNHWATLHIGRLWFALALFPGEGADLSFGVLARGIWRTAQVQI